MIKFTHAYVALLLIGVLAAASACSSGGPPPEHQEKDDHQGEHKDEHKDEHGAEAGGPGVIELAAEAQQRIGLKVEPAVSRSLPQLLSAPGKLVINPDRVAHVSPRTPGQVVRIYKNVGDRVAAGEALALLRSAELAKAQNEYLQASARVRLAGSSVERQRRLGRANVAGAQAQLTLARSSLARVRQLWTGKIAARKEVLEAEHAVAMADLEVKRQQAQAQNELGVAENQLFAARGEQRQAASELRILGAAPGGGSADGTLTLRSPIAGSVVERELTAGKRMEAQDVAFKIYDTSSLWAEADLREDDLSRVRTGQAVTVVVPAFPGKRFPGKIVSLSDVMDTHSRTVKARIAIQNPGRVLRPEMFVTVAIAAGTRQALAVRVTAVQNDGQRQIVYVLTGPATFQERAVKLGEEVGDFYPVLQGLKPGERVVVAGAFRLRAEASKGEMGEHHH